MSKEQFYDAEVAPVILDLGARCEAQGLSFLAVVEWAPGEHGRTASLQTGAGLGIRTAECAASANGNVDSLILALMKHGRKHGHSSILLAQLGVPHEPAAAE